ncbi:arsenic resistance protein [Streptomyces bauhiniae]|uniref:arsenic resistance protein n=1 Tax=Streptomyces bauhiniae TaxID=2340725 RepID=UPI003652488B
MFEVLKDRGSELDFASESLDQRVLGGHCLQVADDAVFQPRSLGAGEDEQDAREDRAPEQPGRPGALPPPADRLCFVPEEPGVLDQLQVPAAELLRSLRDGRFLAAAVVVDFVVVPLVVAAMFIFLPADQAVRLGVLLVLLCPWVDYVIVFSGLAAGSSRRLLAATPVLLVAQMMLLPGFLYLFMGSELADIVEVGPFVEAFLILIVIPLALAWALQAWAARRPAGQKISDAVTTTMVPLMAATLPTVVASQMPKLGDSFGDVVPYYVLFLVVMAFAGRAVARLFRLDAGAGRAIVFGATRNLLVVLPLALAMPDSLAIASVVVVTQTLVEVLGMVAYVRLVPRLVPDDASAQVSASR